MQKRNLNVQVVSFQGNMITINTRQISLAVY
jgi:hypothetical protein